MSERWDLPHDVYEDYRRERDFPQVVKREREIEAERDQREAVAASRRKRFLTSDSEWPRVASINEDIERQR